jgi:hypothetical protein
VEVVANSKHAPLRARWVCVFAVAMAVANLVETLLMVWPRSATSPLGAPLDAREVWEFSGVIAVVLAAILAVLYRVRATRGFVWVAALGLAAMLLCSFALLWTGHLFTLLIGLGAFWMLLFLPPERAELPDDGPLLRRRERSR